MRAAAESNQQMTIPFYTTATVAITIREWNQ